MDGSQTEMNEKISSPTIKPDDDRISDLNSSIQTKATKDERITSNVEDDYGILEVNNSKTYPHELSSNISFMPSLFNYQELVDENKQAKSEETVSPCVVRIGEENKQTQLSVEKESHQEFSNLYIEEENNSHLDENDFTDEYILKATDDYLSCYVQEKGNTLSNISSASTDPIFRKEPISVERIDTNILNTDSHIFAQKTADSLAGETFYYTPEKNLSDFIPENLKVSGEPLHNNSGFTGKLSDFTKMEFEDMPKNLYFSFSENQNFNENETMPIKAINSNMMNTNSCLVQRNITNLTEYSYHSTPRKNNFYDFLRIQSPEVSGIFSDVDHCISENPTYFENEEINAINKIANDLKNAVSEKLMQERLSSSGGGSNNLTTEKIICCKTLISTETKTSRTVAGTHQLDSKDNILLTDEMNSFKEIECEVKNTDSENLIKENLQNCDRDMEYTTDVMLNTDNCLSNLKVENVEIPQDAQECDVANEILVNNEETNSVADSQNDLCQTEITDVMMNTENCLSNSKVENFEIPQDVQECDVANETFVNNKEANSEADSQTDLSQTEITTLKQITTSFPNDADNWNSEKNTNAVSNVLKRRNKETLNDSQKIEFLNKHEEHDIEKEKNFEETPLQNVMHAIQPSKEDYNPILKSISNAFTYSSEGVNSNPFNVLLQQEPENQDMLFEESEKQSHKKSVMQEKADNLLNILIDTPSERYLFEKLLNRFQTQHQICKSDIVTRNSSINEESLRPSKRKRDLEIGSVLKKFRNNTWRSSEEYPSTSSEEYRSTTSESSEDNLSVEVPYSDDGETVIIEDKNFKPCVNVCTHCNQSSKNMTSNIEMNYEINDVTKQGQSELKTMHSTRTLLNLFSIDQVISTSILQSLSNEELRSGALFTEIVRFLRQEKEMTINMKIREDVRKFLNAAKEIGWVRQNGNRYRLTENIILDSETQEDGPPSKRTKLSELRNESRKTPAKKIKEEK